MHCWFTKGANFLCTWSVFITNRLRRDADVCILHLARTGQFLSQQQTANYARLFLWWEGGLFLIVMLKFAVKRKPVELFHEAVHSKDLMRVTFLLEQNESQFHIDDIDEDGITALQRSCFTGTLKLVQLLVTYGADINIQDKEGWSVMHAATVARNHSIMRYLIATGAPLGLENDQGEQAIDLARDLQSVVILAEGMRHVGLSRDVEDYLRRRPEVREVLEEKLQRDMMAMEQERQTAASDILPSNMSLLNLDCAQKRRSSAADNPRPPTAKAKANDIDLEKVMDTRSFEGVALPNGNFLESSLNQAGLEAGGRGSCAFCPKCGKRRQFAKRQSTVSLCSNSSESSTSSDSAYSSGSTNSTVNLYSFEYGNVETITTAKQNNDHLRAGNRVQEHWIRAPSIDPNLESGKYPTNNGEVEQGDPLQTQRRFSSPMLNNSFQSQGRDSSAINNIYTKTGKFADQKCVIQTTAYQFSPRRYSSPVLIARTSDGNSTVSRAPIGSAIEETTNVNELNSRGVSLLHEAAAKGDAEGVKLLLLHGAEVNRQSLNGSSPLHEAVREGNAVTASTLIEHGADLFSENDTGLLPIDLAPDLEMKTFIKNVMALK